MENTEDYVCTQAQAKKLKELGVGQEKALFRWRDNEVIPDMHIGYFAEDPPLVAFTSQELGELILNIIYNEFSKRIDKYEITFFYSLEQALHCFQPCTNNEAQASAEFLIYLLERERGKMKQTAEKPQQLTMKPNENTLLTSESVDKKTCSYWCNFFCANPKWVGNALTTGVIPAMPHY